MPSPSDEDGCENSMKNNVNKELCTVSETWWKFKKIKSCDTTVVINETMQYYF